MSDGSDSLGQNEIDDLLRQAQAATSGGVEDNSPPASPGPDPSATQPENSPVQNGTDAAQPTQTPPKGSVGDDIQFLLAQAEQAIASVEEPVESSLEGLAPFELKDLTGAPANAEKATLELLRDVELDLRIELGRTHLYLEDILQLRKGSVVPLDKLAGDPVDVFVNGRLIARGEVLVLNDNFCVRVAELMTGEESTQK
jgi:flagellar motor switch protein FliN/FliY